MKTVVITGASRGIGRALAEKFLAEGDFVIGTSRNGTAEYAHENLLMLPLELTDAKSIATCANIIIALNKGIDVFVNNAGIWNADDEGPIVDIAALRETLETDVIGPIDFSERISSLINQDGHVVNISSRRGSCSWTKDILYPSYSIAKAALNMYTRKLAARLHGKVTVSCIHPGSVRTDMNPEGQISVQESADDIYELLHSNVETGKFWYKGEQFPW